MGEARAGLDKLSAAEAELLESVGVTLHRPDGRMLWALDADDMGELLGLAVDLIAERGDEPISAAAIRARAAVLLGGGGGG